MVPLYPGHDAAFCSGHVSLDPMSCVLKGNLQRNNIEKMWHFLEPRRKMGPLTSRLFFLCPYDSFGP